ncbi:MAG: hypothetical protein HQK83_06965 [Fibrobacteria bacterium]|nr:hypothetical protein [Fibrobacteria bacterium]
MKPYILLPTLLVLMVSYLYSEPLKILPLGNSITQGDSKHNTYRRPLYHKLHNAGYDFDFIGSMNRNLGGKMPPNPDFDLDHEGHYGWKIDAIMYRSDGQATLPDWLKLYTPDMAFVHLGTNDTKQSLESSIDELSDVVDTLRADNPNVVIFLAQLIPLNTSTAAVIDQLNALIPNIKTEMSTEQSPIIIVDQNTGFIVTEDTYDNVHPSESGEEKMAEKWFQSFNGYYGPKLIFPNGGESLKAGAVDTIRWSSKCKMDSVVLEYNVGTGWQLIVGPILNTDSYPWEVPDLAAENVVLRIRSVDSSVFDSTNAGLSIIKGTSVKNASLQPFSFSVEGFGMIYDGQTDYTSVVSIFTVTGKPIITLSIGQGNVVWDRKDEKGHLVQNGIYLFHVSGENTSFVKKFSIAD